jgi:hemerythrin-like domain-containing protein
MAEESTRRNFLYGAGFLALGLAAPARTLGGQGKGKPEEDQEVSPTEDLMREHGLLNRILLIYEETGRRLRGKTEFDPQVLSSAGGIIRTFIEEYHEKLEEEHLFPRFEKAGKLVELVKVLREQHAAGRDVTSQIQRWATASALKNAGERGKLERALAAFLRMYRPHEAREDTVLFPALHGIVSRHEFDALGEDFEKKEHELFGAEGFERMVDQVAGLEKKLGIYNLAQFTPR